MRRRAVAARRRSGGGELVRALAFVEATIDFADEELPADDVLAAVADDARRRSARRCERELAGSRVAERLRDGFEVALVGRPNVGKSTLLNALAGREVALTSEVAGTTRDVIEVRLDLDGLPLTLLDMAGLRDRRRARSRRLGVARARERAAAADLRVFLVDDRRRGRRRSGSASQPGRRRGAREGRPADRSRRRWRCRDVTGAGIDALLAAVAAALRRARGAATAPCRTRGSARRSSAARGGARAAPMPSWRGRSRAPSWPPRSCARRCARLISWSGRVDVEAVLDVIFRSFCLGK